MAINRIYSQYRNSPKSIAWYNILPTIGSELDTAFDDIKKMYDIDSQIGAQLDLIGRVVVQPRNIVFPIDADVAEFGDTFAEFGDETTGAVFSSALGSDNVGLTDEEYRLVLKSKIQRNTSDVTIDSIITAVNTILIDASVVQLVNGEDMTFSLVIAGTLTATEISLLASDDFIPTPQGVRFGGYVRTSSGVVSSTLDDVGMVATGTAGGVVSGWDSIYDGGGINPLYVDVESGNGDVWFVDDIGEDVLRWDSTLDTVFAMSYPLGDEARGVAVNGSTGDAIVTSDSVRVYQLDDGDFTWSNTTAPFDCIGPSIDKSNDDQFIAKNVIQLGVDTSIYKRTGGAGTWDELGTLPSMLPATDTTVNSSNGDVWALHQGSVYKSTGGGGSFSVQGIYPEAQGDGIAVDSSNGDVWLCTAASGTIYKRTGGVGSYDLVAGFPGVTPDSIAVNSTNGQVYIADSTSDTVWRLTP